MARRTYRQYCGLAEALDLVGQRWTLLIVRDLVPGPRRFTDLFDGLPGISTDLLADRLRALEAAGAVQQRNVRHPAPVNLYELTDRGHELARVAGDLARWGGPLLPAEADDYVENARWPLTQRSARFRGGFPDGDVHIVLDGEEELTFSVDGDRGRLRYGLTQAEPRLALACSSAEMLGFLLRPPDNDDLPPGLVVDGDPSLVEVFFRSLHV